MPPESWFQIALGEYAKVIMGQSPESDYYTTNPDDTPFLQGNRTFGSKYPTFDTFTSKVTKLASPGSVIVSVRAPVGDTNIAQVELCLGRGVAALSSDDPDNEFLYYLVKNLAPVLNQNENGSTFGSINKSDLENLRLTLPDPESRIKIGRILSSLDSKIELNRVINDNLLQFARLEYKTFKKCNEYTPMPLSDIASINARSVTSKDTFDTINYLDTGSITAGVIDNYQHLTVGVDEIPSRAKRIVRPNDIVFSTVRPNQNHFGILTSIPDNCIVSTGFTTISSADKSISNEMIYLEITSDEVISTMQQIAETSTSAYPSIRPEDLGEIEVPIFSDCEKMMTTLLNIFKLIDLNNKEIRVLNNIRDCLLPKLMSGEIDVSTLEIPN